MTPALLEGPPDPTTAVRVLAEMRAAGFALSVEGGLLMCEPLSRLTDSQRETLRAHKAALIGLLTDRPSEQGRSEPTPPAGRSPPPPEPALDVRCGDCRHGQPATDPWSWHLCAAGAIRQHGWGMAPRRCERWEGKVDPDRCQPTPVTLASRVAELVADGWSPWNADARARSEAQHRAGQRKKP